MISALILYGIMKFGDQPNIIHEWSDLLANPTAVCPEQLFIFIFVPLLYLLSGFGLASLLVQLLKDRLLLPETLWASEIMKLLPKGIQVDVEVLGINGKIARGRLASFQPMGENGFELLLAQAQVNQKDTLIWISSELIRVMHCETDVKKWIFHFPFHEKEV
jgi:hypothetical protein